MGYSEWTGARYHVVYKNSVHFASAFLDYLCSQNVPTKYNCMGVIKYKYGYLIELLPKEFNTPRELAKLIQSKISFAKQFREELSRTKFKTMLKEGKAIVETMRSNQDTSGNCDRSRKFSLMLCDFRSRRSWTVCQLGPRSDGPLLGAQFGSVESANSPNILHQYKGSVVNQIKKTLISDYGHTQLWITAHQVSLSLSIGFSSFV